jgi:hypothetical protein
MTGRVVERSRGTWGPGAPGHKVRPTRWEDVRGRAALPWRKEEETCPHTVS